MGGRRRSLAVCCLALSVAAATCGAPALAHAPHRTPRVLYSPGAVGPRPAYFAFPLAVGEGAFDYFYGPGSTVARADRGSLPRIRWRRWGARAQGVGTFFGAVCAERKGRRYDCSHTRVTVGRATVTLWRLRRDRYTRMRFTLLGFGRAERTMPYELRAVRGAETHAGRTRGLRWCGVAESRRCLAP